MTNKKMRELLSKGFHTVDADIVTGKKINNENTTGFHYLADFEIENIINTLNNEKNTK